MKHFLRLPARAVVLMLASAGFFLSPLHGADNAPANPAAPKPAVVMLGQLSNGAIELLAITEHPSDEPYGSDKAWWTADGSPAPRLYLAESEGWSSRYTTHSTNYELYFRAPGIPDGATWILSGLNSPIPLRSFSATPIVTNLMLPGMKAPPGMSSADFTRLTTKTSGGKPVAGNMAMVASAPWGTEFADITVGIATGEWETIGKVSTTNGVIGSSLISSKGIDQKAFRAADGFTRVGDGVVSGNLIHGEKVWSVSMFAPGLSSDPSQPRPTGNAKITVVHNVNTGRLGTKVVEWAVRVIAVDQAGKEFFPKETSNEAETNAFVHATYVFDNLPFAQAKEFRLQVRSFQSAEFRHVALKPKPAPAPAAPAPKP